MKHSRTFSVQKNTAALVSDRSKAEKEQLKRVRLHYKKRINRDVPQISKFVVNFELLVTKPIALMEQTVTYKL